MITPRDPHIPYATPVDFRTGRMVTEHQGRHLQALREASEQLFAVMHNAEGSVMPGEHQAHAWSSRRMAHAATLIETAIMFAEREVLEL